MARPEYGEAAYRAAVAVLRADVIPCASGCGRRATSPDHVPALADHAHVAGSGCCALVPRCAPCNLSRGAATGNRRRGLRAPRRRLAPGSGWARA